MGYNDKHNGAAGRDPDFGAIFMSNSRTKRECFKKNLFGLPASEIQFVEKVKSGMILFLFEYEKRQLHGVFKASCDGGMNIVPNAITSLGVQYPAQVKFVPIWFCKPVSENTFRDAIRENYFSAKKFNFGLSEKQVCRLLHLFSMRRLEPEVPGRHLTRTEETNSDRYPTGKGGRCVDHGMLVKSIQNDLAVGDNSSPVLMHQYKGNFSQYNGQTEYIGLNADDIIVNNQGRSAGLEVDATIAYGSEYLHLKDESRFTACENENYIDNHPPKFPFNTTSGYDNDYFAVNDESRFADRETKDYMDMRLRPYNIDRYSKIPSDKIRVYDDGRSSISDRLMGEDLRKTDQRMGFLDDIPGSHDSNVNPTAFYRNPISEQNSLVQNHIRPTSAMIHPFQAQSLNTSCATQGDVSSLLYNPDAPEFNSGQLSALGIDSGSESIVGRMSPSTNFRRTSLSREPCLMDADLKDMNRWHNIGGGFPSSLLYSRNRDCMPFNEAQNSDQLTSGSFLSEACNSIPSLPFKNSDHLTSESLLYEACNSIPSLKSSSASIPPLDIGNGGGLHEPLSCSFHNLKSSFVNNVHPIALRENPSHGIILQGNEETYNPDIPWANEGHSQVQYDGSLDHGYDIQCYGDSQNGNHGHPRKKSNVFSRLSFVQEVRKHDKRNNSQKEKYDFHTSVDEVMDMAHQNRNQWMTKRKANPSQPDKAESFRGKTISSRMDVKKQEKGKNAQKEKYDFHASVDQVMDMAQECHNQWMTKRKPNPCQPNKAESLRGKTQITGSKMKSVCFEDTLEDVIMDSTTASGGNSDTPAEEIRFVDFKRRSKVRKPSEEIERSLDESKKSKDLLLVQQKRRKLIRPTFTKSTASDDRGVNLDASQNLQVPLSLGGDNVKDVSENCCTSVQAEFNVKTDAEVQNITGPTHFEGKNGSHAMGYIFHEGGEKAIDERRKLIRPNFNKSTSSNEKGVDLDASQKFQVPVTLGSDNVKDVSENCCTSVQAEFIPKTDAEVQNITAGPTHIEGKNGSHAMGYIFHEGGENAIDERKKLIHPNFNKSTSSDDKGVDLDASQKFQVPSTLGSDNVKDVSENCCTSVQAEFKAKTDAEAKNITAGPTHIEAKNGSHAMGYIFHGGGEKANNDALSALNDGSERVENSNHHNMLSSTSCKEEVCHTKEGLCTTDNMKSAYPKKESLPSICQEHNADRTICGDRVINPDEEMPQDCGWLACDV